MPTKNLNAVLLPLDIRLGDKRHNLTIARERIASLPQDTDLVILPELFNVGFGNFENGLLPLSETTEGLTIKTMREISAEFDISVIGGFVRREEDFFFNCAFVISEGKLQAIYDKRHLFAGPEQKLFRRGEKLSPIINIKGWNIRIAICYDLRFPVWNRSKNLDYDAVVFIANWVHARHYAWRQLIIARAIENQAYVLACNREGRDIYGEYMRGDSLIVNAMGYSVGTEHPDGSVSATLDCKMLESDRQHLQPWRMADDFTIHL